MISVLDSVITPALVGKSSLEMQDLFVRITLNLTTSEILLWATILACTILFIRVVYIEAVIDCSKVNRFHYCVSGTEESQYVHMHLQFEFSGKCNSTVI